MFLGVGIILELWCALFNTLGDGLTGVAQIGTNWSLSLMLK